MMSKADNKYKELCDIFDKFNTLLKSGENTESGIFTYFRANYKGFLTINSKIKRLLNKYNNRTKDEILSYLENSELFFHNTENPLPIIISERVNECFCALIQLSMYDEKELDSLTERNWILVKRLLFNVGLINECLLEYLEFIEKDRNSLSLSKQIITNLNLCIIIARTDYFRDYFDIKMNLLFDLLKGMERCNIRILYRMGLLNFKRSCYSAAEYFLLRAINYYKIEGADNAYKSSEYFQSKILLAYCYEYSHNFEKAIKILIDLDINKLIEIAKPITYIYDLFDDDQCSKVQNKVKEFYKEIENNNIFRGAFEDAALRDNLPDEQRNIQNGSYGDRHETLHSLAHCCNELAIKLCDESNGIDENNEKRIMAEKLFKIARTTMLFVVNADKNNPEQYYDFKTCLFMIYGEAKDFGICEKQIDIDRGIEYYKKNNNFRVEVDFYKYLVSLFSFKSLDEAVFSKEVDEALMSYTTYAENHYDYDALSYIEIFSYKYNVAKVIKNAVDFDSIKSSLKEYLSSKEVKKFKENRPSPFVNDWIRLEYNKINIACALLFEFFDDETNENLSKLFTMASKYMQLYVSYEKPDDFFIDIGDETNNDYLEKLRLKLISDNLLDEKKFIIRFEFIPEITIGFASVTTKTNIKVDTLKDALKLWFIFETIKRVLNDFISPRSIFILAPLTSAIPYQYQTGNFNDLEETIFESSDSKEHTSDLVETKISFRNVLKNFRRVNKDLVTQKTAIWEKFSQKSPKLLCFKDEDDDNNYYYRNTFIDDFFERPIIRITEITSVLDKIYDKPKTKTRHHGCPNTETQPGCRAIVKKGNDSNVLLLLDLLFVSENNITSNDTVLINYIRNANKTKWTIIIFNGVVAENVILDEVAPAICCVKPDSSRIVKINLNETDKPFFVVCYSTTNKACIEHDLEEFTKMNKRFWFDENLTGEISWVKQVFDMIIKPACKKVIFYISQENITNSSNDSDDGFYKEVKKIYNHNKKLKDTDPEFIHYLVIAIGISNMEGIPIWFGKMGTAIKYANPNKYKLYEKMFFSHEQVYTFRSTDPSITSHFEDVKNKLMSTFTNVDEWRYCHYE